MTETNARDELWRLLVDMLLFDEHVVQRFRVPHVYYGSLDWSAFDVSHIYDLLTALTPKNPFSLATDSYRMATSWWKSQPARSFKSPMFPVSKQVS